MEFETGVRKTVTDIILETIRAIVLLGIVMFLWNAGRGRFNLARQGWGLIVGGFGLLLFGSVLDITDNFENLNRFVIIGDTEVEAFLEKFVGFLGGFLLLAIGLMRWIPGVQSLSDLVDDRTKELHGTNENLVHEINDRKMAENTARESEQRFKDFAEIGSDWFWEMGPDLSFTYVSDRVEVVTGVPVDFLIGKTRQEISGEDFDSEKWQTLNAATDARKPFRNFEYPRKGPNGEIQYLSVSGTPVFDVDGGFIGYRGSATDISEYELALDRARIAEQQLRTAIEALEDAFVIYDAEDRLLLSNEKYRDFYSEIADLLIPGQKFEDIIRIGAERGLFPDAVGCIEEWVSDRMRTHLAGNTEIEQRLPSGRWLKISERPIPDGGIVGFRVDITQLKSAQENAEAANQAKSAFLATMSHEIRTPIAGILGMADILLEDNLSDGQRKSILSIKGAGQALITILNDILDLSKIQVGKLEVENIDFALHELITESLDLFYQKASDKDIALGSKIAPDLPRNVIGDPTRIRQILVNLIGNAVKFTERGSVTLCVAVSEQSEDTLVLRFEVIDTGIGIRADHHDDLFQDFAQVDASTARKYEGTGLGLAISKRLTELMGGEIGVESIDGEGSTFWFTVHSRPSKVDVTKAEGKAIEAAYRATRSLQILLAEDNDLNQMIITAVLSKFSHHITVVDNGRAAVDAVSHGDFDLVLMDVRMPEMDGPDATRTIRQGSNTKAGIPIIAVTADAMVENRADYFEAGMNACVTKPIHLPELLDAINQVLDEEVHISS